MSDFFRRVESIYHEALSMPAAERIDFLQRTCRGDEKLQAEVESLLRHEGQKTAAFQSAVRPVAESAFETMLSDSENKTGRNVGPYFLEQRLGEGGMGTVYLALDTRLGRQVAVKMIGTFFSANEQARARFVREARSAAALSHAHIAAIYDVGESDDRPYLVMEYVKGVSLRVRLSRGLDQKTILRYASEIASAVEHAHSRQIIHRDLKPENILVTDGDRVKVIDFGLARSIHEQGPASTAITQPNSFVGSMAYGAPELLAGGSASPRSDIYSLGVVLYEMACGEHPYGRHSGHSLVSAILSGSYLPCSSRNSRMPTGLGQLIDRCMSREPANRFKDGAELVAALRTMESDNWPWKIEQTLPTLAILDFRNIGGGAGLDWLGTGIAETLSADLAKVGSVRIVSRARVNQVLRSRQVSGDGEALAMDLGIELGARWVVTGGYQGIGDRIRVTAALLNVATGGTLATEKIDGRWEDLFDVQDRVVTALLETLTVEVSTAERERILPAETRNLVAYEQYVRGRQQMYLMGGKSLANAIAAFEHSVALDPDYALAYSGLGTAHCLQFIRTTNPEDVSRANRYLERAVELDPELGEPYPWLCYLRFRMNDPAGAISAGQKGLTLQPDLPEAHYFLGGVHYMAPELQPGELVNMPTHLTEAIRLRPKYHPAFIVLGGVLLNLGRHSEAERVLTHACDITSESDLAYRFVGARTLLAMSYARRRDWAKARQTGLKALEELRGSDHVYTTCFQVHSHCVIADVELRCGNTGEALIQYRAAHRILKEAPRVSGGGRLLVRVMAGMGAAYAGSGEPGQGRRMIDDALSQLHALGTNLSTSTFEGTYAAIWMSLATAQARISELDQAIQSLQAAREKGWMDLVWLQDDPELAPLRSHPVYQSFVDYLRPLLDREVDLPEMFQAGAQSESSPF